MKALYKPWGCTLHGLACLALLAAAMLAGPGSAHAAIIVFTDCIAGNPPAETTAATCAGSANNVLLSAGGTTSVTYSHDLSNNGFIVGDTVTAATLAIDFNDDGDRGGNEGVDIFIDFNGNGIFAAAEQVADEFDPNGADFSCTGACQTSLIAALADGLTAIRLAVGGTGGTKQRLLLFRFSADSYSRAAGF
jgi:hypothetical protein